MFPPEPRILAKKKKNSREFAWVRNFSLFNFQESFNLFSCFCFYRFFWLASLSTSYIKFAMTTAPSRAKGKAIQRPNTNIKTVSCKIDWPISLLLILPEIFVCLDQLVPRLPGPRCVIVFYEPRSADGFRPASVGVSCVSISLTYARCLTHDRHMHFRPNDAN